MGRSSPRGCIAFGPLASAIADTDAADPMQAAIATAHTVAWNPVTATAAAAINLDDWRRSIANDLGGAGNWRSDGH